MENPKDYLYRKGLALNKNIEEFLKFNNVLYGKEERSFIDIESDKEIYIERIIKDILIETNNKDMVIEEKNNIINELNKRYKIPLKKACEIFNINERTYRRKKKMSV